MGDIPRDERGRFVGGGPYDITSANAREMQARGVQSRIERSRDAIREAFKRGEDITWSDGYENAAAVLVDVIFDKKEKTADRVRAFAELRRGAGFTQLDKAQPVRAIQHNYFASGEEAKAYLDAAAAARCPECNEFREYGIEHVCTGESNAWKVTPPTE